VSSTTVIVVTVERVVEVSGPGPGNQPPVPFRIVVPLDGSELSGAALVPARALARRTGAPIELMTTRLPDDLSVGPTSYLDDVAAGLDGLATETTVRMERDPVEAIEAVAAASDVPALVVMSTHGRGRARRATLGSTAELVVANGSAPVLLVGPDFDVEAFDPDGPVLVAHDGEHDPHPENVAVLARAGNGQAVVLEVATSPTGSHLHRHPATPSEAVTRWAGELGETGIEVDVEARYGVQVHRVVADAAAEVGAWCVAVTTRGRTGVKRVALGSAATSVVRHSAVPVLVTRARDNDDDGDAGGADTGEGTAG
jgi:nucleotide-binding universal stress UspA family protein